MDYPRPELESTVNYLEAAYLSSSFRTSPRPDKPLKVIIAGAGKYLFFIVYIPHFLNLFYAVLNLILMV